MGVGDAGRDRVGGAGRESGRVGEAGRESGRGKEGEWEMQG